MWGTSSPDDKLTGDLDKAIATSEIRGCRLDPVMAGIVTQRFLSFATHFEVITEPSLRQAVAHLGLDRSTSIATGRCSTAACFGRQSIVAADASRECVQDVE